MKIHNSIYDILIEKLINAYKQVRIGNPLDSNTLMGPLIDDYAIEDYKNALIKVGEELISHNTPPPPISALLLTIRQLMTVGSELL